MVDFLSALDSRDAFRGQVVENSSRLAFAFGSFSTTGWGETRIPDCLEFGLTFVKQPYVASSWSIDDAQIVEGRYPMISSGVVRWRKNARGFYTGAWVAMKVETRSVFIPTALPDPAYDIEHTFIFAGLATKELPDYLANDAI
jgi:hypothetical protein